MLQHIKSACAALVIALVGCQGTVPTSTFNDKEALGIRSVTTVRTSATALMTAGKLTIEQDAVIQKQLDLAAAGMKIAKSLQSSDPVAAALQLEASIATIEALKTQTGVKP